MNRATITILSAAVAGIVVGAVTRTIEAPGTEAPPPALSSHSESRRSPSGKAASPVATALGALHGTMDLKELAHLGLVLTQLSRSEFHEFLDHLERDSANRTDDRLPWIFTWWHGRDPEAAIEWLRPRLIMATQDGPLGYLFETTPRGKMIAAWAAADPERAIGFAREHPSSGVATRLLQIALNASPNRDHAAHLALLLEFPARTRKKPLEELLQRWASEDGIAALAAAETMDDAAEREACAAQALQGWSENEPLDAFEHFRAYGLHDQQAISQLLYNVGKVSPQAAVEWVKSLDNADFARLAPKVVELWARSDPTAALEFAMENGVDIGPRYAPPRTRFTNDSLRHTGGSSMENVQPLALALREHPKKTLEWILNLPPGPDRDRIVELVPWSASDVEQSLAIFPSMSADGAARAARTIASRFDSQESGRA